MEQAIRACVLDRSPTEELVGGIAGINPRPDGHAGSSIAPIHNDG